MNLKLKDAAWVDSNLFNENRSKFPADELRRFAGQHVAWNRDGTRILAGAEQLGIAVAQLIAAGFTPDEVVWSWVPAAEESLMPSLQEPAAAINGDSHQAE